MTDIEKRLRIQADCGLLNTPDDHVTVGYKDAADEIARLTTMLAARGAK